MAVAPMLKVTVLGHRPVMDETVRALQHAGVLEVEAEPFDLPPIDVPADDDRLRRTDEQLAEARFVLEFLGRYHTNQQPFSTFVSEKFHVPEDKFISLTFDARFRGLYHECVSLADALAHGERETVRLRALVKDLEPWREFRYQISHWRETEKTTLFTGTVPASGSAGIKRALLDTVAEVSVDELGPVHDRQAWVVIAHRCCAGEVRSLLATSGFTEVSFPGLSDYPAEEIAKANARIEDLAAEAKRIDEKARGLSGERFEQAVAMVEAIESQRDRVTVRRDFGETDRTFAISGWVRESQADELERTLLSLGSDLDLTLEKPLEDDQPPVELDNPAWLRPFEVLTDLYGRPAYHELDPTILLAPFFLLFFAICIGDVGYGAMLAAAAWLIKTKLDVAPGVKRFCNLLIYGGIASMGVGVAFASYFALPIDQIPPFLAKLQVLDPLAELTTFLIVTLILGVAQVFFGVLVAAYDALRRGDAAEAVFGQLSTIFLFAMIAAFAVSKQGILLSVGLVGTMLMQGHAIEAALGGKDRPAWDRVVGWLWLAAVVAATVMMGVGRTGQGLALLGGVSVVGAIISKTARSAVIGLLGGAYSVYGMSAFVGDTLSYTRLAALGLSGALVGMVFNLLAGLVWAPAMTLFRAGGLSIVFGALIVVIAAAIFVVGHVFNVTINLLGAFVHPARLQFVEFFSKFYEGGGRPFAPFRVRTGNLVLEAGDAGSGGGAVK